MFADRKIRPNFRPKKVRTKNSDRKTVIIPDDQKIDRTGFLTFEQVFPRKG